MLNQRGTGMTADQELYVDQLTEHSYNLNGADMLANAVWLMDNLSLSFGGQWLVVIWTGATNYGIGRNLKNDSWIFFPSYRLNGWDYRFYLPAC